MDDTKGHPTQEQVFEALDAAGDFEIAYRLLRRSFPKMQSGFFQEALLAYKSRAPERWVPTGGRKRRFVTSSASRRNADKAT